MKLINRKTRKAIRKNMKKAINKHGPAIAAGLIGGIASSLATLASTDEPVSSDGKSRLNQFAEKVQSAFGYEDKRKSRHAGARGSLRRPESAGRERPAPAALHRAGAGPARGDAARRRW